MGLYVPSGSDFRWQLSSTGTTRPAAAQGVAVTPGTAPTMGSWFSLITGAQMVNEAYGLMINFNSGSTSATTRNYLCDIGVDNAGGTSYRVLAPYLMAGHAAPYNIGSGGIWYYFPIFIPYGSSLAVRAMGNVTTAFRCCVTVFGLPQRPDSVRVGTKIFSFGEDTTNARGTSITLGTTSKGSVVQVGSAITMPLWWWQMGYTANDTTMTAAAIHFDVVGGDVSNKKMLIQDTPIVVSSSEQINNLPLTAGCSANLATGEIVGIRGQSSATADSTTTAIAYGLGG